MRLSLAVLSGGVWSPARCRLGAAHLPPLPARVQPLPVEAGRGRGRPAGLLSWLESLRGEARPGPGPGAAGCRPGAVARTLALTLTVGFVLVGVGLGSLGGIFYNNDKM